MKKLVSAVIVVLLLQGCANYDWQFNRHYTHNA